MNRTKEYILEVFNDLLKKMPMDKITVALIIKQAEVSKSTFYRHYLDKYDLMHYNYKKLIDTSVENEGQLTWAMLFYNILHYMETHVEEMTSSYETYGINSFNDFMYNYSMELLKSTSRYRRGCELSEEETLICSVFCHGCVDMSYEWMHNAYHMDAVEAGRILESLLPAEIARLKPYVENGRK